MIRPNLRALLLVISVLLLSEKLAVADETDGDALVASVVAEVTGSIPAAKLPAWDSSQEANDEWVAVVFRCIESFARLHGRSDERVLVYKFVSEFGLHGPEGDFAILLSLGRYGVPHRSFNSGLVSVPAEGPLKAKDDVFRNRQLLVAECQTLLFSKHPERLERYAYFLWWSGFVDETFYSHHKRNAAERMASSDYWWHARNAQVLLLIDGNVFKTRDPNAFYPEYMEWLGRVSEFDIQLPDRTKMSPFPDWTGAPPISGGAFREFLH